MRHFFSYFILTAVFLLLTHGCSQTGEGGSSGEKVYLQPASGHVGEVILVMDSSQWRGPLGSAMRKTFEKPMEALPQDEKLFTLHYVHPDRQNSVLRKVRNLIYVITLDDQSKESKTLRKLFTDEALKRIYHNNNKFLTVKKDEYARGQVVMYLYARDGKTLANQIRKNSSYLRSILERIEKGRIQKKLLKSRAKNIETAIKKDHGCAIKVPFGFQVAQSLNQFVWLRQLDQTLNVEKSIFIYYDGFTSREQLTNVEDLREHIGTTYLRDSQKPELYITRQDILPILSDTINFKEKFALKNRGLWKVSDNSGGGPFISYSFVDEKAGKFFYIEGYVYAPGEEKLKFIRELDAILSTFETPSELTAS